MRTDNPIPGACQYVYVYVYVLRHKVHWNYNRMIRAEIYLNQKTITFI